jgi:hypothetical protein
MEVSVGERDLHVVEQPEVLAPDHDTVRERTEARDDPCVA